MSPRTTFLARLIGLYSILVPLAIVMHKQASIEMIAAMLRNPSTLFLLGLLGVSVGLAMVLGHNVWTGGALPVVVTLIGWASLIKGLLLLFLSPKAASGLFLDRLRYEQLFYVYTSISILIGICLTFMSRPVRMFRH